MTTIDLERARVDEAVLHQADRGHRGDRDVVYLANLREGAFDLGFLGEVQRLHLQPTTFRCLVLVQQSL